MEEDSEATVVPKESETMPEVGDGEGEQKKDVFFKTSLCSYFRKSGSCRHAFQCRYAHGEDELRPRPDGTWDPTSVQGRTTEKLESTEEEEELEEEEGGNSVNKCIRDLPLRWTSEDLSKLLADKVRLFYMTHFLQAGFANYSVLSFICIQGLAFRSSRKRKRSPVGFVEFECDEHALSAKEVLFEIKFYCFTLHGKFCLGLKGQYTIW